MLEIEWGKLSSVSLYLGHEMMNFSSFSTIHFLHLSPPLTTSQPPLHYITMTSFHTCMKVHYCWLTYNGKIWRMKIVRRLPKNVHGGIEMRIMSWIYLPFMHAVIFKKEKHISHVWNLKVDEIFNNFFESWRSKHFSKIFWNLLT